MKWGWKEEFAAQIHPFPANGDNEKAEENFNILGKMRYYIYKTKTECYKKRIF